MFTKYFKNATFHVISRTFQNLQVNNVKKNLKIKCNVHGNECQENENSKISDNIGSRNVMVKVFL